MMISKALVLPIDTRTAGLWPVARLAENENCLEPCAFTTEVNSLFKQTPPHDVDAQYDADALIDHDGLRNCIPPATVVDEPPVPETIKVDQGNKTEFLNSDYLQSDAQASEHLEDEIEVGADVGTNFEDPSHSGQIVTVASVPVDPIVVDDGEIARMPQIDRKKIVGILDQSLASTSFDGKQTIAKLPTEGESLSKLPLPILGRDKAEPAETISKVDDVSVAVEPMESRFLMNAVPQGSSIVVSDSEMAGVILASSHATISVDEENVVTKPSAQVVYVGKTVNEELDAINEFAPLLIRSPIGTQGVIGHIDRLTSLNGRGHLELELSGRELKTVENGSSERFQPELSIQGAYRQNLPPSGYPANGEQKISDTGAEIADNISNVRALRELTEVLGALTASNLGERRESLESRAAVFDAVKANFNGMTARASDAVSSQSEPEQLNVKITSDVEKLDIRFLTDNPHTLDLLTRNKSYLDMDLRKLGIENFTFNFEHGNDRKAHGTASHAITADGDEHGAIAEGPCEDMSYHISGLNRLV